MEGQSEVVYDVPDVDVQDSEMDDITLAFTIDATRGRLLRVESSSNGVYQELALQNPQGKSLILIKTFCRFCFSILGLDIYYQRSC